ncbi:MAG: glycosyltransferase family 4 protein [candidate division NC10 bacterium]|nr:glycosyltransferase family 4 protein [candidate division NC10 bacterium]
MTERLRVAMVALDFHRQGGSEGRTGYLVDALLAAGHDVHLVGARIEGAWDPRVVRHDIRVAKHPRWVEVLTFIGRAKRLALERFDVVHSQIRPYLPGVVTVGGGCHRFYLERVLPGEQGPLAAWAKRCTPLHQVLLTLERRRYRADGRTWVIANSRLNRDGILAYYPLPESRIRVAYNGVDTDRFAPENAVRFRAEVRRTLELADGDLGLIFVGSNFSRKGLELVLNALVGAGEAGLRMRLVVLGGRPRPRWRRQVAALGLAGRVRFVDPVPDPERYYAAADVFVLPTRFDPFANATLEAMAAGLPVVTTRMNGVAEILTPGTDGYVLDDPPSAPALAKLLVELTDADLRRAMGRAARGTALRFPWRAAAEAALETYRAMLGNR